MNKTLAKDVKEARYGCTKIDLIDMAVYNADSVIQTLRETWPYGSENLNARHREAIKHLRAARRAAKSLWKEACREAWEARHAE